MGGYSMNATYFVFAIASLVLLNGLNAYVVELTEDKMQGVDEKDLLLETLSPCTNPDAVCRWRGTAPICKGQCEMGETICDEDPCANGEEHCCVTGTKYFCCRDL